MTEPANPGTGTGSESSAPPSPSSPSPDATPTSPNALDAYVAANAARYTEEALYSTLVAAGYPADDVRAALANAAANLRPQRTGTRAVRTILVGYVAVFALLSAGMLLNHRSGGPLMPNAEGGIGILAMSLGVCFAASLIWVASRRLFVIIFLIFIALYGAGALTSGGGSSVISLIIVAFAIGGVVVLLRRPQPARVVGEPELGLLLLLPVILLLGVAGICVASGLPIPGTS